MCVCVCACVCVVCVRVPMYYLRLCLSVEVEQPLHVERLLVLGVPLPGSVQVRLGPVHDLAVLTLVRGGQERGQPDGERVRVVTRLQDAALSCREERCVEDHHAQIYDCGQRRGQFPHPAKGLSYTSVAHPYPPTPTYIHPSSTLVPSGTRTSISRTPLPCNHLTHTYLCHTRTPILHAHLSPTHPMPHKPTHFQHIQRTYPPTDAHPPHMPISRPPITHSTHI